MDVDRRMRKAWPPISPVTINKELRHLRAVLTTAHAWEYLPKMPKFKMLREPEKLPTYVTADELAAIYQACDVARIPRSHVDEPERQETASGCSLPSPGGQQPMHSPPTVVNGEYTVPMPST